MTLAGVRVLDNGSSPISRALTMLSKSLGGSSPASSSGRSVCVRRELVRYLVKQDELAHCPRPVAGVRRDRDRGRRALVMRLRLTGAEQEPDRHGRPCPRLDKQRASAVRSTSPGCSVTGSAPLDCSARWAVVSSVENTMMESCNPAVDRPAQPRAMTSGCLVISVSSLAYQWFSVLTPAAQASGVVWCRRVDARTTSSGVNRIC